MACYTCGFTFAAVMKFTCCFILFCCVFAATFSKWLVIASFEMNEKYIASVLCVNRNNPSKHCNGHCFLKKQLDKDENPGAANDGSTKTETELQLFLEDFTDTDFALTAFTPKNYNLFKAGTLQGHSQAFFHPPGC